MHGLPSSACAGHTGYRTHSLGMVESSISLDRAADFIKPKKKIQDNRTSYAAVGGRENHLSCHIWYDYTPFIMCYFH
uniref:Uncharacterized protein n=1 Tax=Anguilla anguilla TaxID=7936 RepID=A0A0E9WQH6_ANGAN